MLKRPTTLCFLGNDALLSVSGIQVAVKYVCWLSRTTDLFLVFRSGVSVTQQGVTGPGMTGPRNDEGDVFLGQS